MLLVQILYSEGKVDADVEVYRQAMAARGRTSACGVEEPPRDPFLTRLDLLRGVKEGVEAERQSLRDFGNTVGVPHSTVHAWSRDVPKTVLHLREIADRAELPGVKRGRLSVDWLCGLSEEPSRDAHAEIGEISAELHKRLTYAQPLDALPAEAMPRNHPGLVDEVAALWWATALDQQRKLWADRLRALDDFLVATLAVKGPRSEGLRTLLNVRRLALRERIRSVESDYEWSDLARLSEPVPLVAYPGQRDEMGAIVSARQLLRPPQVEDRLDIRKSVTDGWDWDVGLDGIVPVLLQTSWPVVGGYQNIGLAVRWEGKDMAWFLDKDTLKATERFGDAGPLLVPAVPRLLTFEKIPTERLESGERRYRPVLSESDPTEPTSFAGEAVPELKRKWGPKGKRKRD